MKKELNEGLKERQENKRMETIEKVEDAIKELQDEGFEITTKLLIERTGLARSTFSKEHVKKVLETYKVGRFKTRKSIDSNRNDLQVQQLKKENEKQEKQIIKLKEQLESSSLKNDKFKKEIQELKKERDMLRGEVMRVYNKASMRGIDLE